MAQTDVFDYVVIGSGPAGEKAAAHAAYFGKRVALVEKSGQVGGAPVGTGGIPLKRFGRLRCTSRAFTAQMSAGLVCASRQDG